MANLNYYYKKFVNFCKNLVNENPYVAKAILIHLVIIVFLYALSIMSTLRFDSNIKLETQINKSKKMQFIQATSISSQDLNKQMRAYENNRAEKRQAREEVKQAREDLKKARKKAIQKAKEREIDKAKKKAQAEAKRKEQQKKFQDEKERQLKEKKRLEEEKKLQAKKDAEKKAIDERLAKAKADAQEASRKQVAQSQAQSAISSYISQYQERVGSNWIKDSCRGIYKFPRAITRNGKFIKLTGTTGNYRCDQSLIDAVKNTQPPALYNNVAKQTVQSKNLSFKFNQN